MLYVCVCVCVYNSCNLQNIYNKNDNYIPHHRMFVLGHICTNMNLRLFTNIAEWAYKNIFTSMSSHTVRGSHWVLSVQFSAGTLLTGSPRFFFIRPLSGPHYLVLAIPSRGIVIPTKKNHHAKIRKIIIIMNDHHGKA